MAGNPTCSEGATTIPLGQRALLTCCAALNHLAQTKKAEAPKAPAASKAGEKQTASCLG